MLSRLAAALLLALLAGPALALKTEMMSVPGVIGPSGGPPQTLALEVVSEQAMVRISSGSTVMATLAPLGYPVITSYPSTGWALIGLPGGMRVADGLAFLKTMPGILAVDPNRVLAPIAQPNDPSVSTQISLSQIDAQGGWNFEVGTSCRATVVIVDSGVQGTHPELQPKLVAAGPAISQYCAAGGAACVATPVPTPACNHATQVAGIAAAATNNSAGIAGVSWGAQILSVKVFDDGDCNPAGGCPFGCGTSDAAVTNAVAYARTIQNTAQAGKVVINMSLGCAPGSIGCGAACNGALQAELNAAAAEGIPTTISTGNNGGPVNNPAICAGVGGGSGIIPVGSVNSLNTLSSFSSRGDALAANGVVAPGESVYTTNIGGSYTGGATGTSFSAPHVAGLAALILSARPNFSAADVQNAIRAGAESIGLAASLQGAGRINVFKALRVAVKGTLSGFDGEVKPTAFPNPFKVADFGVVSFALPPSLQGSRTSIKIFTLDGTFVREVNGLSWNGKNTEGGSVASGTYVFVVTTSAGTGRGRFSVLR